MKSLFLAVFIALNLAGSAVMPAMAQMGGAAPAAAATPSGIPSVSEEVFVKSVMDDLNARFSTIADAEKAGYFRYTDEDETGSISYANLKWNSVDEKHPSQLWYDAKGRLLGADFSVLQADSKTAPEKWAIAPARWQKFGAHVHFGLIQPDGSIKFGGAGPKTMAKGGGTVAHPTAEELVKAGVAKKTDDVKFVFAFPAIWDLEVWVLPNKNGAFAEMNPDVIPTKAAKSMD